MNSLSEKVNIVEREGLYAKHRICERIKKIKEGMQMLRDSQNHIACTIDDMETELYHLSAYVQMESDGVIWEVVRKHQEESHSEFVGVAKEDRYV